MTPYLFVYGTLMDRQNEIADTLRLNSRFVAPGKFKGLLFDIGEYPGAIAVKNGENYVFGSVLLIMNQEQIFKILDEYEGFGEDEEKTNLFIRDLLDIETATGIIKCWVYLYNLPVEGFKRIISGKWFG